MSQIFEFKELLDKFNDEKKVEAKPPIIAPPDGTIPCACGKKFMPLSEVTPVQTPFCQAVDTICHDCLKDCYKLCRIICTKCRTVVGRVAPHKDLKTGFEFVSGQCYHTPYCPNCEPDCITSPLAEKAVWDAEHRR